MQPFFFFFFVFFFFLFFLFFVVVVFFISLAVDNEMFENKQFLIFHEKILGIH